MSLEEVSSNKFPAHPSWNSLGGLVPGDAWPSAHGPEQEHAQILQSIPGTAEKGLFPKIPPGTAILILTEKAKEQTHDLMQQGLSAFTQESGQQQVLYYKRWFEEASEDPFRQRDIKKISQWREPLYKEFIKERRDSPSLYEKYGLAFLSARMWIHKQIEKRLLELKQAPYDPEEEEPLNSESVRLFSEYCRRKGLHNVPDIAVTPDGFIGANWFKGKEWVGIRFLDTGKIRVAVKMFSLRGSLETTIDELLSSKSTIRLPDWI